MLTSLDLSFRGTSRFEIRRRIGEGAVGVVYEAYDREHGALVALKTLRTLAPEGLLSLKNEFRAVQDLRHPNLVRIGELLEADGTWFFTMELLHGLPLNEWTRASHGLPGHSVPPANDGPLVVDETRIKYAFAQLTAGLSALHVANKVHRDVKPSNLLVTREGRVVILDFGVTRDVLAGASDDQPVGTAAYMAPEQALGDAVGPEADWYALGAVLYQALTGRLPWSGTFEQIIEQKISGQIASPRTHQPGISRELEELCLALLRTDPRERPRGEEVAALFGAETTGDVVTSSAQRTTFIGRSEELTVLRAAFAETRGGAGSTVVVSGESGVGKSFLMRRFLEHLHARRSDVLVLSGRCYERESVPYKAFDGIIDQLGQLLAGMPDDEVKALLPAGAELLVRAFPVLEMVDALGSARVDDAVVQNPQELRARVFTALRGLFARLARARPLVLAIDDLQWADVDSLALLREIMRQPDEPGLLLLATQRVGTATGRDKQPTLPSLPGNVRYMQLEPLPFRAAMELTRRLLAEAGVVVLGDEQVRRIVEDAKGHPLFIDELVRLRAAGHSGELVRLDDALHQRVTKLEPAARRTLELLAVAGSPLSLEVAARAGSLDFAQLFDIATELRLAALVRMDGAARDSLIEPYHDRIRESVASHLTPPERAAWHLRLAGALEQQEGSDSEVIASHWFGGGKRERAAEYYARAADEASSAMAFERAARMFKLALDCGTFGRDRARELEERLADALENGGMLAAAAEVRLALAKDAAPGSEALQKRRAAELFMCSGHYERGLDLLRTSLERAGVFHPGGRGLVLVSLLFWRLWLTLRGLRAPRRPEATSERLLQVDATWSAGHAYSMNDNVRGAYFQTRCLLAALATGDERRTIRALGMAICTQSSGGLAADRQTQRMLARARQLSERIGTPEAHAYTTGAAGFAHFNTGRYTAAKVELSEAEALMRDQCVGVAFELNSLRAFLFRALFALGDLRELRERSEPVLEQAVRQSDRYMVIICQTTAGAFLGLQVDRLDRAERAIEDAQSRLVSGAIHLQHYWTYTAECQVALYAGEVTAVHERMAWLTRALKKALLWRVVPCRMLVVALRARTAVTLALARPGEAEALRSAAERDAARLSREREAWGKPAARAILGSVAAGRAQNDEAIRHYAAAAEGYEREYMRLYAAAARRHEGVLRGGSAGRALVAAADAMFASEGVVNPARMAALLAGELPR